MTKDELKILFASKVKDVVRSTMESYDVYEGYKPTVHEGRGDYELLIIMTPLEQGPKRFFSVKITEK